MLLVEIWKTCSTNQKHETGRLKHTRTKEKVITVYEMVNFQNYKGQKQAHRLIRQISDLTMCSIVPIITAFLVRDVFCLPTRLLSIIVSFSCIYI